LPAAYTGAFLWGVAGSAFFSVAFTALQEVAPMNAHGRVVRISATLQSWTKTVALPLGGLTLAALGVRAGSLTLAGVAGVALAAGLIGMTIVTARPAGDVSRVT
jgi:hypothetical protein